MRTGWRKYLRRLAILLKGTRAQRELEEEMRLHIELEARELIRSGVPPEEARREALRRFGGVDRHREAVREAQGVAHVQDLFYDLRHALRGFGRNPGFAAVALITLALGIGASTAIFSVVDAVLLRPLPYAEPDRLVRVHPAWEGAPDARLSPAEYLDVRDLEPFEEFGAYAFGTANITGDGEPQRLDVAFTSSGVLPALGVSPSVGRGFTAEEDRTRARVVVISHGLWQRRFGGRTDILETTVQLNGTAYEVVGVLPEGFALPEDLGAREGKDAHVPLGISSSDDLPRGSHFLYAVARVRPGVSLDDAQAVVARAGEQMVRAYPDDYPAEMGFRTLAPSLRDEVLGPARPALRLLVGAVGFLLLIACANVANLLLARAEGRDRELALRRALGAGRRRLVRQMLVESVTLGLLGAVLGTAVAWLATEGLLAIQPPEVPRLRDVGLNATALLFAGGLAFLTGIAFGLLPAIRASRGDPVSSLGRGRDAGAGSRNGLLRRGLVVTQMTAAVVLLAVAGLLGRTFLELTGTDPGYRTEGLLTAEITLPSSRYADADEVSGFFERLAERLRAQPGVTEVGAVSNLPLASSIGDLNFHIEGRPVAEGDVSPRADWQAVTPGYLRAMEIDLFQGRLLDEGDRSDAPGAVLISRTTAERYWPGRSALGERFTLGGGAGPGQVTVVGVVEDVAHAELGAGASAQMYIPHGQFRFWGSGAPVRGMDLVVRTDGPPADLVQALRAEVAELDPALPLASVRTMDEIVAVSLAQPRLLASLVGAFALIALVLSAVGVYGVTSYVVGQRTREFGIRMALGAESSRVVRMVVLETAWVLGISLVVGIGAALLLSRGLRDMLYGVAPTDPATLTAVAVLLGTVGLVAALVPARRATRVDPASSLRAE